MPFYAPHMSMIKSVHVRIFTILRLIFFSVIRMQIRMKKCNVGSPFLNLQKERLHHHSVKTGNENFGTQIGFKSAVSLLPKPYVQLKTFRRKALRPEN